MQIISSSFIMKFTDTLISNTHDIIQVLIWFVIIKTV